MIDLIIYFTALIGFFIITFKVLRAINLENIFKKGKIWEIQAFYFIIAIAISHILASVIMKFLEWAVLIIG